MRHAWKLVPSGCLRAVTCATHPAACSSGSSIPGGGHVRSGSFAGSTWLEI